MNEEKPYSFIKDISTTSIVLSGVTLKGFGSYEAIGGEKYQVSPYRNLENKVPPMPIKPMSPEL